MENFSGGTFFRATFLFWLTVAVLLVLALCLPAQAGELGWYMEYGETRGEKQADGVWYQEAYPYWMDTEDATFSIGVTYKTDKLKYSAAFLPLGKHFVNAIATSDGTYNPYFVTHCGSECGLASLIGRGSVSGVMLSVSRDVRPFGLPLYAEVGVYANVKKWQVTIGPVMGDGSRPTVELAREHQIDLGPMVGLGVRYDNVEVGWQYIYLDDSSEGDPMTPMLVGAHRFMVRVGF